MATTWINPKQLAKINIDNKVLAKAIDVTGSAAWEAGGNALDGSEYFLVQHTATAGGNDKMTKKILASTMQNYFSKTDVIDSNDDDVDYKLLFVSGAGDVMDLQIDADILKYNASSNKLSAGNISGSATISGHELDIETAAAIGGALTVAGTSGLTGKLTVTGISDLDGGINVSDTFTVSAAGAVAGATTISGSGVISGLSLDIEKGADFNAGGLTNAGAIAGATTISGSSTISGHELDIETAAAVGGALTVAGTSGLTGKLTVSGVSDLDGGINVADTFTVSTAGAVAGATTISGSSTISGQALDIEATADIKGAVSLGSSGGSADTTVRGDLNVSENLTVTGDFTVNGTQTVVDSTHLQVEDTLIVLGSGSSGEGAAGDRGLLMALASENNKIFFWDESESHFAFASTTGSHAAHSGSFTANSYDDVKMKALVCTSNITSSATISGHELDIETAAAVGGALTVGGTSGLTGKLTVAAVSDLDGGINVNDTFTVSTAGAVAGATTISGSSTISGHAVDIETTADLGGKLTVVGVSDLDGGIDVNGSKFTVSTAGALSASSNLQAGGTVRLDGAATVVADLDADYLYFMDAGDNLVKKDLISDVLQLAKGDGVQVASTGLFSITNVSDIASKDTTGSILSTNYATASLTQEPLSEASVQVYLNGILLTPESANVSGSRDSSDVSLHDYRYVAGSGSGTSNGCVVLVDALDDDDVIQVRYIKK